MIGYFGKVCKKHPELKGERYTGRNCKACVAENSIASRARRTPERKEKALTVARDWKRANTGRVKRAKGVWNAANPEKVSVIRKEWKKSNKHKVLANVQKRKAGKMQATPRWANRFFVQEAYHLAELRRRSTGVDWHVDHVVPLRSKLVCGLHCENNLRVIPAKDNILKSNQHWPDMPA